MKRVRSFMNLIERLENRELLTAVSSVPRVIDSPEIGRADFALGDIDADNDLDLVVADGTVGWKENRGDGTFHFRADLGKSTDRADAVYLVDLDQDDDLDIVMTLSRHDANFNRFVDFGWLENLDGHGGFSARRHIASLQIDEVEGIATAVNDVQIVDVDRDSDLDLIYWRRSFSEEHFRYLRYVPFLIRNDGSEFVDAGRFGSVDTTSGAAIPDIDGDGHVDLVVRNDSTGQLDWYRNTEQGLEKQAPIAFDDPYWRFGDFDGDGDADLGGESGIYLNDGRANFEQVALFQLDVVAWEFGMQLDYVDVDADGDLDVIYHVHGSHNHTGFSVAINEGGEFHGTELIRDWFYSFAYGDVTGDGKLDLLFQGQRWRTHGNILLFDAFAQERAVTDRSATPSSVSVRDVDQDGDLDLIVSSINHTGVHSDNHRPVAAVHWYENQGDLSFGPRQLIAQDRTVVEFSSDMVADIGDLDNDGKIDMITAFGDEITIRYDYLGEPTNLVIDTVSPWTTSAAFDVKVSDFDQDGDLDIVFLRDLRVFVAVNAGGREFGVIEQTIDAGCRFDSAHDFDADGDLDLVGPQYRRHEGGLLLSYAWSENVDGLFAACEELPGVTFEDLYFKSADFDGDGDLDRVRFDPPGTPFESFSGELIIEEARPIGDVNNDGQFDSTDLTRVFAAAEYEDQIARNSTYEEGDWNGDGEFDSADFVAVFQAGTYVRNVQAVRGTLANQFASFEHVVDDSQAKANRRDATTGRLHRPDVRQAWAVSRGAVTP